MQSHTNFPSLSASVVCAAALLACTSAEAQQVIPLPGIVIEGATLEKAPVAKTRTPKPSDETAAPKPNLQSAPATAATSTPTAVASDLPAIATAGGADAGAGLRAGMPAGEIGSAVTVVTSRDIQQQQARTSADVLRALPGVTVTGTGGVGSVTQVRIRGADGRHTRVLIDGVEANTTKDAEFDFSNLSPEDIERIEVIRGPMSALYGSGALGGVINIETKAARGPLSLSVRAEGGSFGTRDLAGRLAAGNDSGYFSLTAQHRTTQGFAVAPGGSIKSATDLQSYGLRAGVTLAPAAKLDVTVRYTDKRAGFPDFGVDYLSPRPFATADDARNELVQRSLLAGVRLSWDALNGALTQELKTNYTSDISSNTFDPVFGFPPLVINHSRDEGTRATYAYSATYRLPTDPHFGRHAVTGLIEKATETFKPFSDYDTSFGDYNGDGIMRTRNRLSYAGEWRGTFAERLSLTAGVRRDDNDTFQDFNTWRTTASFDWKELALRPHASLGTGVKLPGMYDQFGANSKQYQSNPNLRPETSRGYDVGVETKFLGGRATTDITYFSSVLRDKIYLNCCAGPTFNYFPDNVANLSTRRGIELATSYQITPALYFGAAYTYTDARQPDGTPEYRRVPHGYRFDTRYLFDDGKGTLSIAAINNSRTPDVAFDSGFNKSRVDLQAYWLVQLAASYKIQPNVELYGRVENAFNARYQEVYGYNTAGVGAYAGVKIKFDDLLNTGK